MKLDYSEVYGADGAILSWDLVIALGLLLLGGG